MDQSTHPSTLLELVPPPSPFAELWYSGWGRSPWGSWSLLGTAGTLLGLQPITRGIAFACQSPTIRHRRHKRRRDIPPTRAFGPYHSFTHLGSGPPIHSPSHPCPSGSILFNYKIEGATIPTSQRNSRPPQGSARGQVQTTNSIVHVWLHTHRLTPPRPPHPSYPHTTYIRPQPYFPHHKCLFIERSIYYVTTSVFSLYAVVYKCGLKKKIHSPPSLGICNYSQTFDLW
jgi:hypothetical protein